MSATLVVYAAYEWPLRQAIDEHLRAFERYSRRPCFAINLAIRRPPRWLRRVPIDLVVFHTTYLAKRGSAAHWPRLVERARPLLGLDAVRVALPQDEYLPTGPLCEFVEEFAIPHVFSVAPESEWPAIYPTVDRSRTQFHHVLTGYLDPQTVARISGAARNGTARTVDVGYRAKDLPAWLGRHAKLKADIGRVFSEAAPAHGLAVDISTRPEDTLTGEDWMRFMLSCRYTIGVEGGASVLDRDGSVRACCERVLAERPDATFEELERECFPGRDGEFRLFALSPRHLEAVAARTCQVLIEGEYDGVLEAGRHYLPLRRDFSNLDEVLETMRRDDERERIVETAYQDIVASGTWSYPRFVEQVERTALAGRATAGGGAAPDLSGAGAGARLATTARLAAASGRLADRVSHADLRARVKLSRLLGRS